MTSVKNVFSSPEKLAFGLILALGAYLRFKGISFGLPYLYHADEPIVVNHALSYGAGDLNPHFFKIPPLVSYLLFVCYGIFYLVGTAIGSFEGVADFERYFYSDPSAFYLIGRVLFGAALGLLSVFLFGKCIKRFFSTTHALIGSLFLAVCFLHVRQSHYIYVDIPLFLVMVISFIVFFHFVDGKKTFPYHIYSGILIGVAAAIKYNGGLLAVPYLAATLLGQPDKRLIRHWFLAGALSLVTFIILNPFSALDYKFFISEIMAEKAAHPGTAFLHHATYSLWGSLGPVLSICAGFGFILALVSRNKKSLVFVVFFIAYYLILWKYGQPYPRYVLPLLIPALFFATDFILFLGKYAPRTGRIGVLLLVVGCAAPAFLASHMFGEIMQAKDVRTLAKEWVDQNIPPQSKIALDVNFNMPQLLYSEVHLEEKRKRVEARGHHVDLKSNKLDILIEQSKSSPAYYLYELMFDVSEDRDNFLLAKEKLPYDLKVLKEKGIDYVITVSLWENNYNADFYAELDEKAELLMEINPYRTGRTWPYTHPLTGGPFLFDDLLERERNGQPLKIYRLT